MMQAVKRDVNYYLVVGAALYWSSTLVTLVHNDAPTAMGAIDAGLGENAGLLSLSTPVIALLLIVGTFFSRFLAFERVRRAVAISIAATACLVMALATSGIAVAGYTTVAYPLVLVLLRAIESVGLILLWGYAFASLDKRTAGQTVSLTALCAVFGYFCLLGIMQFVPQVYVIQVLYILSAGFILFGTMRFTNHKRTKTPLDSQRIIFYVSRAIWGVAIGTISVIPAQAMGSSSILLFFGMAIIAALLLAYQFSRENLYTALPVFPLIITGLVFVPFLFNGLRGIEQSSVAMMWVAWILLSSFQLSKLKETFGMSETMICFSEKAVLMSFWAIGHYVGEAVQASGLLDRGDQEAGGLLALVATYTVILYASYAMFSLVYSRREDQLFDEMAQTREQRLSCLYDALAEEFGLSPREREVMEMLAQGYTRTYIREKLVISDGTAKAHIAHVYQKLGIHKKDDLLKLVGAKEKSFDPGA